MHSVTDIPLDNIEPDPNQPRKYFDESKLTELAVTIKEHGVQSPAKVHPHPTKPGAFILDVGERRWRASQIAGMSTLPCLVDEPKPAAERLELQLIENNQRADLSALEEGEAFRTLEQDHGQPIEQIMSRTGKSRSVVYARMALTKLAPGAKKALAEGRLQPSVAELAATIGDAKLQDQFVKECLGQKLDWHVTNELEGMGIVHEAVSAKEESHGVGPEDILPLSFRAARTLLRRRYSTRLSIAKFDTTDADLVPSAGDCGSCPFRSGNQPELPGVANGKADDLCTKTSCFEAKTAAAWNKTAREAQESGLDVLTFEAAKRDRVFDHTGMEVAQRSPYVDPEKELPHEFLSKPGKAPTWGKLLGKKLDEIPKAIVQDASGAPRELIDYNAAVTALQEAGKIVKPKAQPAPTKPAKSKATKATKDTTDKRELRVAFLKRLEREVITSAGAIPEKKEMAWWRWVVECIGTTMLHSESALLELVDTKKPWPKQLADKATNQSKAKATITGIIFSALTESAEYDVEGKDDSEILAVAELLGINVAKLATEVADAAKAEKNKTDDAKSKKKGKAK